MNFAVRFSLLFGVVFCRDSKMHFGRHADEVDELKGNKATDGLPNFRFAAYYADHMVLQKAPQRSTVWGFADDRDAGKTVEIVLTGATHVSKYQTRVTRGAGGATVWSVQLEPCPPGGPYSVSVSLRTTTLVLNDVLFGDVWICSGQSNMVFSVPMLEREAAQREFNLSSIPAYSSIRLFTVAHNYSTVPLFDLSGATLPWSRASPDALGRGQQPFKFFSAVCWVYGRRLFETLGYPIGLIESDWVGTPDEAWMSPDALKKCNLQNQKTFDASQKVGYSLTNEGSGAGYPGPASNNSVLWNAMIHPLINMTVFGTIWYQGEADRFKDNYVCTFPAMISDWRKKFHIGSRLQTDPLFPFGFVQLAGFRPPAPGNITTGYAPLRWQQTAKFGFVPNPKMPNTFMAVAMDLPDFTSPFGSIHPRDKVTVGRRLAASGLTQAYNLSTRHQGPIPTKFESGKQTLRIIFDEGKTILIVRNSRGFELCCPSHDKEDRCDYKVFGKPWEEANVVRHDTVSITISTKNCTSEIVALRYAWRESPCDYKQCAVYSVDHELPAPPVFIQRDASWSFATKRRL